MAERLGSGPAILLSALLLATLWSGCSSAPRPDGPTLVDDAGRDVAVGDLSRIVVTSVDLAETFVLLGHADRLVGVPDWIASSSGCVSVLPGAEDLPRIGRPVVIAAEEVLAQAPTLVIDKPFPLSPSTLADRLDSVGVPVYRLDNSETLANVRHTLETVGRILSHVDATAPENATRIAERFDSELERTRARLGAYSVGTDIPALRALYQLPAGLVASGDTSGSLLIGQAGAQDIAAQAGLTGYRQLSAEVITASDPERLVVSCTAGSPALLGAPKFAGTTAARLGPETVFVADPATSALVGPRFPEGVRAVAEWLHPGAFDLISPVIDARVEERTLTVDASASTARNGTLRFRFDAGDGSAPVDDASGVFTHHYPDQKRYQATLLLIDHHGRIHTHAIRVPASP